MTDIARLTGLRDQFARSGDRALVAEVDAQLARHGITIIDPVPLEETAVPVMEHAVKRKRG